MRCRRLTAFFLALVLILSYACTTTAAYATLRNGDQSQEVLLMQQALLALGFLNGSADGKYGTRTENAIRAFQKKNRLDVDGIAGNETLTLLYGKQADLSNAPEATQAPTVTSPPADSSPSATSTLLNGSTGERVLQLQNNLNALGYSCGKADGKYGNGTENAVRAFQRDKKLGVDGKAGARTLSAIAAALAQPSPTPVPEATQAPSATVSPTTAPSTSTTDRPSQTLRLGSFGNDVKALQNKLNEKGFSVGTVDGKYGNKTLNAIKAVQRAYNLNVDGIAGSKTYKVLWADSSSATQTPTVTNSPDSSQDSYSTLRYGDRGNDVKSMQSALKKLSYTVSTDGVYGAQTQIAVTAFQKQNGLNADGVAGSNTLSLLYSGSAKAYEATESDSDVSVSTGGGPSTSQVKLLHWFNEIKPTLRTGQTLLVYDPATNINWSLRLYSLGRHADSEPLTKADTAAMYKAFGNKNVWGPKTVYVKLPNGTWTLAATHNVPHLSGSIKDNDFDGHLCVHFLRDMSEAQKNDPNYGVQNQNAIRKAWKNMTGITVD